MPYKCFVGETLGVPIHVFGPETHMTSIVGMALGKKKIPPVPHREGTTANFLLPGDQVNIILVPIDRCRMKSLNEPKISL